MDEKFYLMIGLGLVMVIGLGIWYGVSTGQAYGSVLSRDSFTVCLSPDAAKEVKLGEKTYTMEISALSKNGFMLSTGESRDYWTKEKGSMVVGDLTFTLARADFFQGTALDSYVCLNAMKVAKVTR